MPEGSSSAAPVTRPGPNPRKNRLTLRRRGLCWLSLRRRGMENDAADGLREERWDSSADLHQPALAALLFDLLSVFHEVLNQVLGGLI